VTKYKSFLFTFLLLATIATLFPPFQWQPEKGETPCKYCLLFDESTKHVSPIGLPEYGDEPDLLSSKSITRTRHLVISELFMEYLGALLVGLLVQVVVKAVANKRASA
jgi:hypothetical protein